MFGVLKQWWDVWGVKTMGGVFVVLKQVGGVFGV